MRKGRAAPHPPPARGPTCLRRDRLDRSRGLRRARIALGGCAAARRDPTSWPSRARAQGEEKLVQLRERLDHRIRRPGAGSVQSFLRGIELVHDQQRLATLFLECHRDDRPTLTTFLVGRSEEHTSELQSLAYLVCRLLL